MFPAVEALSATALVAMSSVLHAQQKKLEDYVEMKKDGGFAPIKERKEPNRLAPLVPPGALSIGNLAQHCTGCQLCVSVCENHVLRPSTDLMKLMQPEMAFDRGYCRPECVKCSEVCPTGAIKTDYERRQICYTDRSCRMGKRSLYCQYGRYELW